MNRINQNFNYTPKMYNRKEVAEMFNTHVDTITSLIEIGILKPIKIGKSYMFSTEALIKFQYDYEGMNLSNRLEMKKSYELVSGKKSRS